MFSKENLTYSKKSLDQRTGTEPLLAQSLCFQGVLKSIRSLHTASAHSRRSLSQTQTLISNLSYGSNEPEPVDTGAIDFQPINETPQRDLTPEELALAFGHDPTPAAPPEQPIDTSIEPPVTNAPTTPPPTSAEPEPAEVQTPEATDIVPPTPNPHPPVAPPPSSPAPVSPPGSPTSMPTVQAPAVPNVPPLTPPLVDNSPLTNPQVPSGDIGSSVLEGGSNENPSGGTPGLEHPATGGSSSATPIHEPTLDDLIAYYRPSTILGENLVKAGINPPMDANGNRIPGWEAHHIIPHGSSHSAALRKELAKLGIDINDAINGVWLPKNPDVDNPDGTTTHNQTFRETYFEFLTEQFRDITTREEAEEELKSIRKGLKSGELAFELKPRNRRG